jgi:hypothetical protein
VRPVRALALLLLAGCFSKPGPPGGGGGAIEARVISTSYFSTFAAMPSGMARTSYEIDTAGVHDDDLLIIIASIDNGSTMLWPNPIAPGFDNLEQVRYGNDGQTYITASKLARDEPESYTGVYDPTQNLASGSSTITLIAISNASTIEDFRYDNEKAGTTGKNPAIATSAGVTATLDNDLVLFAFGIDWESDGGTGAFQGPNDYRPLVEMGDHGDLGWEWTAQAVYANNVPAGPTGALQGKATSDGAIGTTWWMAFAIGP